MFSAVFVTELDEYRTSSLNPRLVRSDETFKTVFLALFSTGQGEDHLGDKHRARDVDYELLNKRFGGHREWRIACEELQCIRGGQLREILDEYGRRSGTHDCGIVVQNIDTMIPRGAANEAIFVQCWKGTARKRI